MWNHAAGWLLRTFHVPEVKTAICQTANELLAFVVPTHRPQAQGLFKSFIQH